MNDDSSTPSTAALVVSLLLAGACFVLFYVQALSPAYRGELDCTGGSDGPLCHYQAWSVVGHHSSQFDPTTCRIREHRDSKNASRHSGRYYVLVVLDGSGTEVATLTTSTDVEANKWREDWDRVVAGESPRMHAAYSLPKYRPWFFWGVAGLLLLGWGLIGISRRRR